MFLKVERRTRDGGANEAAYVNADLKGKLSLAFFLRWCREREREREREICYGTKRLKNKNKNEDKKNSGDTFVEDCALKMRLV